jgi:hypothetical protein
MGFHTTLGGTSMRYRILVGAVVSVVLVACIAAAALAGRARDPITSTQTLSFIMVTTSTGSIDADPPGTSTGDQQTSNNVLRKHGEKVGHLGANCSFTFPQLICWAVLRLQEGQITLAGQLRKSVLTGQAGGPIRIAITGGTGAYQHVHGTAVIEPTASGKQQITLTLTP